MLIFSRRIEKASEKRRIRNQRRQNSRIKVLPGSWVLGACDLAACELERGFVKAEEAEDEEAFIPQAVVEAEHGVDLVVDAFHPPVAEAVLPPVEDAGGVAGIDADQFRVTADPMASLAPGESTTFTVRFSPTSEGTKTATLHIASNDGFQNPFDFTLVGTPNVPTVAASGNNLTLNFVGAPGGRYRVQYLPGLAGSWTDFVPPALYTVPASGVISHTDLNPHDTLRLYRAVPGP